MPPTSHQRNDSDLSITPLRRPKSEFHPAGGQQTTLRYSLSDFPILFNDDQSSTSVDWKAWCTTIGGCLTAMATFGYTNAFGVYQDIYTRSGAASASRISWIGSTQMFFMLAMALPAGKLLDMGYFRQATLFGSVLYVFSLFMVSIAHTDRYYQIFLAQGLGMGIGAGFLYVPALAVQSHHWKERKAFAMGMVTIGSSIGSIFFPIMLNQLFQKPSVGFGWGVRASAFVVLGLLVLANLLMSDKRDLKSEKPKAIPDIRGIMTDVPYLLCILACFFINLGVFFPYFYLQLFSILQNINPNIAFYFLAILSAASLPGRLIPNILADRFGPFNAIIPIIGISGALIFAMFGTSTVGGVVAFAIFYGFFSGAFISLCPACLASLSKSPDEVGIRFGIGYFLAGFGVLVGAPIDGELVGDTFTWHKPIVFSAVTVLAGFLFLLVVRWMLAKRKGTQLV
ncbi:MFS general substrate transporter [Dendrothele bispora CBS 962.96]|uniref:MFS general substrate transporter n=1 Tax=Dendrothele bispora (strain CBS 962.96) TaxID=1314807 RepID=A0A4S8LSL3_DENBC|nr:MFS general substrate transporter [Dendrothele bispora CBS 962.96]